MERKRRPGYLTQYAAHAGITKTAAAEQLKRVGIDYMMPFDHTEADRRRQAARYADRAQFSKPIYSDPDAPLGSQRNGANSGDEGSEFGIFSEIQAKREHYRSEIARLEFEERIEKLVEKEQVREEAFHLARLVRDAMLNIPSRIAGILAAESDQRKVHDLLENEIRQALEALVIGDTGGPAVA